MSSIIFKDSNRSNIEIPEIGDITFFHENGIFYYKNHLNVVTRVGSNNSYSLTEIKTGGNWIDGRPIYRKVIDVNELENILTSISYSGFDLKDVIKINFTASSANQVLNTNVENTKTIIVTNASSTEVTYNLQGFETYDIMFGVYINKFDETIDFYNKKSISGMDLIENVNVPRPFSSEDLYVSGITSLKIIIEYTKTTD